MAKTPTIKKQDNKEFIRLLKRFMEELESYDGGYDHYLETLTICPEFGEFIGIPETASLTKTEYKLLTKHCQLFRAWLKLQRKET